MVSTLAVFFLEVRFDNTESADGRLKIMYNKNENTRIQNEFRQKVINFLDCAKEGDEENQKHSTKGIFDAVHVSENVSLGIKNKSNIWVHNSESLFQIIRQHQILISSIKEIQYLLKMI